MGRKNKRKAGPHSPGQHTKNHHNKKHHHHHKHLRPGSHNHKRQQKGRFWAEDCPERLPTSDNVADSPAVTVWITRVELTDDHGKQPQSQQQTQQQAQEMDQSTSVDGSNKDKHDTGKQKAVGVGVGVGVGSAGDVATTTTTAAKCETVDPSDPSLPPQPPPQPSTTQTEPFVSIRRTSSATGPLRFNFPNETSTQNDATPSNDTSVSSVSPFKHLPHGDCGDGVVNPYPTSQVQDKYWAQRKRLFSRFDEGIQLDQESWYSVTPEAIAKHHADRIVALCGRGSGSGSGNAGTSRSSNNNNNNTNGNVVNGPNVPLGGLIVVDAFGGCGGNAIAMALHPGVALVVCVDTDRRKLEMAASNASIYGVDTEKVLFVHANACLVLQELSSCGTKDGDGTAGGTATDGDDDRQQVVENGCGDRENTKPGTGAGTSTCGVSSGTDVVGSALTHGYTIMTGHTSITAWLSAHHRSNNNNNNDSSRKSLCVVDAVFLSPPWGGTEYHKIGKRAFGLLNGIRIDASSNVASSTDECLWDGEQLLGAALGVAPHVVCFLPRNTNGMYVGKSASKVGYRGCIRLEQDVLAGKLKTISVYLGPNVGDGGEFLSDFGN